MKRTLPVLIFIPIAGCINATSTDCTRGAWLGGAAGTDRCLPDHVYQPTLLPEQQIAPYMDAVQRDIERRTRELQREQRRMYPR